MNPKSGTTKKKTSVPKNTIETLKDLASPSIMIDQLMGNYESNLYDEEFDFPVGRKQEKIPQQISREFTIFNQKEHAEIIKTKDQIYRLTQEVKNQFKAVERAGSELAAKAHEVSKIAVEQAPEKPGIYHIKFLEVILEFLKTLIAEVGQSKAWLEAMVSKRKKRGSLFASLSKKKGTQYSLSQELQSSRSIQ